jgi:hypothetical protein
MFTAVDCFADRLPADRRPRVILRAGELIEADGVSVISSAAAVSWVSCTREQKTASR